MYRIDYDVRLRERDINDFCVDMIVVDVNESGEIAQFKATLLLKCQASHINCEVVVAQVGHGDVCIDVGYGDMIFVKYTFCFLGL